MHVIGLVGGIASGKSAVAAELRALGAEVLDADVAAHRVIQMPEVREQLVERWGAEILDSSGQVDRRAVAKRVFAPGDADRSELEFLESLLHPRIRTDFQGQLEAFQHQGTAVVVIDAPLLLEAGWRDLCDSVLFVLAPEDDRRSRAKTRNWSPEELARREQAQMPIEQKKMLATHVIDNSGSLDELKQAVGAYWQQVI